MKRLTSAVIAALCAAFMWAQTPLYVYSDEDGGTINGKTGTWDAEKAIEVLPADGKYTITVNTGDSFWKLRISKAAAWQQMNFVPDVPENIPNVENVGEALPLTTVWDAWLNLPYRGEWIIEIPEDLSSITMNAADPLFFMRGDIAEWSNAWDGWFFTKDSNSDRVYWLNTTTHRCGEGKKNCIAQTDKIGGGAMYTSFIAPSTPVNADGEPQTWVSGYDQGGWFAADNTSTKTVKLEIPGNMAVTKTVQVTWYSEVVPHVTISDLYLYLDQNWDSYMVDKWKFEQENGRPDTYWFDCTDGTAIKAGAKNVNIMSGDWSSPWWTKNPRPIQADGKTYEWDWKVTGDSGDNLVNGYTGTIRVVVPKIIKDGCKATVTFYPELVQHNSDAPTGIHGIEAPADAPVEYFNLQGLPVAEPRNGVFLRRQGSKVTKVIVD